MEKRQRSDKDPVLLQRLSLSATKKCLGGSQPVFDRFSGRSERGSRFIVIQTTKTSNKGVYDEHLPQTSNGVSLFKSETGTRMWGSD